MDLARSFRGARLRRASPESRDGFCMCIRIPDRAFSRASEMTAAESRDA